MLAILNSLNAHNLPIFQPILMILVSKFMVHRALSDKAYLSLGLLSPLNSHMLNYIIVCILTFMSRIYEPRHEISNNVVCAISKASDQPAHMRSLIRAFASRLNIL